MSSPLALRTRALETAFAEIARTRMAGVPVLNDRLRVEAVGFEALPIDTEDGGGAAPAAAGVLVTPWFMNLVWLPLARVDAGLGVGRVRTRTVGARRFEFIGAHEVRTGAFEACSLFSPMFEFADHAAAQATATAVLAALREPAPGAPPPARTVLAEAPPARRSFLFGRSAAGRPAA